MVIPLNELIIDSFRLRIPLEKVQIIDQTLVSQYCKYYPDLEAIDDMVNEPSPFVSVINGITTRIFIKSYRDGKKTESYIVFTVSAKMLRQSYWEGITSSNLEFLYNTLIAFNVFYCDFRTFCNALITDIDICTNFRVKEKILDQAFTSIEQAIKPKLYKHLNVFRQAMNYGLELNKREKASPSVPYIKIYHKEKELLTKSIDFYKNYLEPCYITDLVRLEMNIKNAKHKKYLNKSYPELKFQTVNEFLQLDKVMLMKILLSGLPLYINSIPKSKPIKGLSPTDIILKYYIENLINLGFDKDKLMGWQHHFGTDQSQLNAKSRKKKDMKDLIERIMVDEYLEIKVNQNGELQEFLHKQLKLPL